MVVQNTTGIDASLERLKRVVQAASSGEAARAVDNGWNVGAMLAHIAFWDRRAALLIRRCQCGDCSESPVELDVINESALPQWQLIPPGVAGLEAIDAAEDIDQLVRQLSSDAISALEECRIRYDRSTHRNEHLDQIEALLTTST